jgi:hypothetical protein
MIIMPKSKKLLKDIQISWIISVILAVIPFILFVSKVVIIHPAVVVAIWFTVFGASLIATGIEFKRVHYISVGIIWLMSSFLTTLILQFYWLVGIVSFGVPLLIFAFYKK